ncbi:hypothetical protein AAG906_015292 [Vitis piasezkii]
MMRDMSYLPSLGLGHHQHGPREFTFTVDHDTRYGLGYTPIEEDARYMVQIMHPTWRGLLVFQRLLRFRTSNGPWVTLADACTDEMDMIGVNGYDGHWSYSGCSPHGPHFALDMFGAFILEIDDDDSAAVKVKPRKFQKGDLVLKVLKGLIIDPRGKFRPSWRGMSVDYYSKSVI